MPFVEYDAKGQSSCLRRRLLTCQMRFGARTDGAKCSIFAVRAKFSAIRRNVLREWGVCGIIITVKRNTNFAGTRSQNKKGDLKMLELLVNISELTAAAAKMNEAVSNYREAVDQVKTAADELASKWEGDAQVAFVNDQNDAYRWYFSLADIVDAMIEEARRVARRYEENINNLKGIMNS